MTGQSSTTEEVAADVTGIARSDPQRVALDLGDRQVSFGELDQLADRLAQRLLNELVGGDEAAGDQARVAVLIEEADALLVAIEAVRRAGLVIVPIDPTTPPARRLRLMEAVGARVLLADGPIDAVPGELILHPLRDGIDPPADGVARPPGRLGSILWTSGSTGEPKGVMCPPGRTDTSILGDVGSLRIGMVVAGSTSASVPSLQVNAAAGWTSVCYQVRHETRSLGAWLQEANVQGLYAVPTVLRQILHSLGPGERIPGILFVGTVGEIATWEDVAAVRAHFDESTVIINAYAQTEVGSITFMVVGPDTPTGVGVLPVGQPRAGVEITLIDDDGLPVATGERGEITVRSTSTSLGYWGEALTDSTVFFPHDDGSMTVRTGDIGRFRPDGALEHLGRKDDMVKVAGGNRVDLKEVERALLQLDGVAEAAVVVVATPRGENRLRAFVVRTPGNNRDLSGLRLELWKILPRYALPDTFAVVESLPRLSNGKLDRRDLAREIAEGTSEEPDHDVGGTIEEQLAAIWRSVLLLDEVRPDDDFFTLGGDSLRAAELAAEIGRRLGREVPPTIAIERPTLAAMAAALDEGVPAGPVVTVRSDGAGLPVFIAHNHEGSIFPGRMGMIRLRADQPVYGFRAAVREGRTIQKMSLQELASDYAREVQATVGKGRVVLIGHNNASLLAFETARQLSGAGTEVALLVLSTSRPPPGPSERRLLTRDLPRRAISGLLRRARQWRLSSLQRDRYAAPRQPGPQADPEELHEYAMRSYGPLWQAYRPEGPFSGPVLVIHSEYLDPAPLDAWRRWVDGPLSIVRDDRFEAAFGECEPRTLETAADAFLSGRG